jgi:hypothetical protein
MSKTVSVEITFDSYYNFSKLCTDDLSSQTYWLSWNFLDKTYKSEEFTKLQNGPALLRNVVDFPVDSRQNQSLIPVDVLRAFPIRVFLCTTQAIIAVANVDPFDVTSVARENITSTLPFEIEKWVDFAPIDPNYVQSDYYNEGHGSSIKVGVRIAPREHEHEEYDDDVFESEETVRVTETLQEINHHQPKQVRFPHVAQQKRERLAKMEAEEEEDRLLRHYRLSVDLRSIGGFKRPAIVTLHYVYPHFGTSSPVRSKPLYVMPNSEAAVSGGAACFESAMSREKLRATLAEHPLKVHAQTRSNLGNELLGELKVDLSAVLLTDPFGYRCPLTGKSFKTMQAYNYHRQTLLALAAAGQVQQAPPRDPVVIYTVDSYMVFTAPAPVTDSGAAVDDAGKGLPTYVKPRAEGGKLRVVLILEDIGVVGRESAIPVPRGYKMHNGAVYDMYGQPTDMYGAMNTADLHHLTRGRGEEGLGEDDLIDETIDIIARDPLERGTVTIGGETRPLTALERKALEKLKVEWQAWQRGVETQWRDAMKEKEDLLRKKLEEELLERVARQEEDLQVRCREQQKLEIRLKNREQELERKNLELVAQEEQMKMRLANKTAELQLLQRRVRDEAKEDINKEKRHSENLQHQLASLQDTYRQMEKRARDAEQDFEQYRAQLRKAPESVLREEAAKLRAQLAECRTEVERERGLRAKVEMEKEHYRAQMQRLALALKREREKSAVIARQDLEQLRLEFLAREERCVCNGSIHVSTGYYPIFAVVAGMFWQATEKSCGTSGTSWRTSVVKASRAGTTVLTSARATGMERLLAL